jgi:hypothetical protein
MKSLWKNSKKFLKNQNRLSPGFNGMCVELLKYGDKSFKKDLLILFNNIWKYQQIPKEWETRIVINIHKKVPRKNVKIVGA